MPVPEDDENVVPLRPIKKRVGGFKANELEVGKILQDEPLLGMGKMFRLNTFSGDVEMTMPILRPWAVKPPRKFKEHDLSDTDVTHLIEWLYAAGAKGDVSRQRVGHAIQAAAEENPYSSAQAALDRLPAWDEIDRIARFFREVCGAQVAEEGMSEEEIHDRQLYLEAVARCFFLSMVARILRPGCKVDTTVILEGAQGTRKSSLLRILAFDQDRWFSDSMADDLANKDARVHLRGKLIIELAEMSQLRSSKVESLKKFLSAQDDKYRPPYGKGEVTYHRQCVFVGTTNAVNYLVDETGNRRFWPIACGVIDLAKAREWRDQLFAEALHRLRREEHWWLSDAEEAIAKGEQRERTVDDTWLPAARKLLEKARAFPEPADASTVWVTVNEVFEALQIPHDRRSRDAASRVRSILRELGGILKHLPRGRDGESWPDRGYRFIVSERKK